jgi:hypothetical protein
VKILIQEKWSVEMDQFEIPVQPERTIFRRTNAVTVESHQGWDQCSIYQEQAVNKLTLRPVRWETDQSDISILRRVNGLEPTSR